MHNSNKKREERGGGEREAYTNSIPTIFSFCKPKKKESQSFGPNQHQEGRAAVSDEPEQ